MLLMAAGCNRARWAGGDTARHALQCALVSGDDTEEQVLTVGPVQIDGYLCVILVRTIRKDSREDALLIAKHSA